MKRTVHLFKIISSLIIACAVIVILRQYAYAEEDYSYISDTDKLIDSLYSEAGADELIFALPDSARGFLDNLYINDFKPESAENLSAENVISAILNVFRESIIEPIKIFICIIGISILTALFDTLKSSDMSAGLEQTLSFVSVLCMSAVLSPAVLSLITNLTETISVCSDFMMIYVPVISLLIISGGNPVSGGMFYSTMIYMCSAVLRVVSEVIVPFLRCISSVAVITNITDKVSLSGVNEMLRKAVRILLTFCMSVFTAFLTMRSVISVSQDSLSNRAVKFAISNFVPLVGGALSDAYQTVVSCTAVLRSGVGVIAIAAIFAVFLPAVAKCLIWQFTLMLGTAVCDVFSNGRLSSMLSSISSVISIICSILLCTMVMYIISTAIILIVGG